MAADVPAESYQHTQVSLMALSLLWEPGLQRPTEVNMAHQQLDDKQLDQVISGLWGVYQNYQCLVLHYIKE